MKAAVCSLFLLPTLAPAVTIDDDPCKAANTTPAESNDCLEHTTKLGEQTLLFSCDNNVQKSDKASISVSSIGAYLDEDANPPKAVNLKDGIFINVVNLSGSESYYGELSTVSRENNDAEKTYEYKLVIQPKKAFETTQDKNEIVVAPKTLQEMGSELSLSFVNKARGNNKQLVPIHLNFQSKKYNCQSGLIGDLELSSLYKKLNP